MKLYNLELKKTQIIVWFSFCTALIVCGYAYIYIQRGFFDDAYIYLTMARNAIDYGTWKYYPVVTDRAALLASSPLHLLTLTIAAALSKIIGFGGRTLFDAKVTFLISGWVSWLVFLPFWRNRLTRYALVGMVMATLSLCFDTTFEFEGGLLFIWIVTLVAELRTNDGNPGRTGILLPIGMLIRPDMAIPIISLILIGFTKEKGYFKTAIKYCILTSVAVAIAWSLIAFALGVYPIPVTYWAKAAIPLMFEHQYLLGVLPERLGHSLTANLGISTLANSIIGWLAIIMGGATLALHRPRFGAVALLVSLALALLIFSRLPANFWWYYQNIACLLIGLGLSSLLAKPATRALTIASSALCGGLLAILAVGRLPNRGPNLWRTYTQSRAQGYLSISTLATGRGTVILPSLGEVIVKNPEIGMMAYFSKRPYFQWDSAGLAQPLEDERVLKSPLRLFYPMSLRETAINDAQQIANKLHKKLPVVEVWAMEDRDYSNARKHCHYVFPQYALCVNPYITITPDKP